MSSTSIARSEIVGLKVAQVLQSPWIVDRDDPNEPRYCSFYLLLESGLLVNIFEQEITQGCEPLSALIDTHEIETAQQPDFVGQRITTIALDLELGDMVVIFESGGWLSPKISRAGHGNYLTSGTVADLDNPDRAEPFVDYWDRTEVRPWIAQSST